MMNTLAISDKEFKDISTLLHEETGIFIPHSKKYLVYNRLVNRIKDLNLVSFNKYLDYVCNNDEEEFQEMVNCLTTNETFFFREKKHFDDLGNLVQNSQVGKNEFRRGDPFSQ